MVCGMSNIAEPLSVENHLKKEEPSSVEHAAFLNANYWQREALTYRNSGFDGFLVLVALLLVLLIENLWVSEVSDFSSPMAADTVVVVLIIGVASGMFTLFSITLVTLKMRRLLCRDVAALHVQQRDFAGEQTNARLKRLLKGWLEKAKAYRFCPASLTYEWYHQSTFGRWTLSCPRVLVKWGMRSFIIMTLCFAVALSTKLGDSHSLWVGIFSFSMTGGGVLIAALAVELSSRHPKVDHDWLGYC
ncbi:unnamed protein product [Discosporangium mesarthrocarpum]